MAVSIDVVYQRVLAIANKEQRGNITPQQFNIFANQAQMRIFEQYFYDINQFSRVHGNSTEYSDMLDVLREKVSPFEIWQEAISHSGGYFNLSANVYRLGNVYYNSTLVEFMDKARFVYINQAPLTKPTTTRPVYLRTNDNKIEVYPNSITDNVKCNYISKPTKAAWGYVVVSNEALYNAGTSVDFQLHESEETSLVMEILELAGISIRREDLAQYGLIKEANKNEQEKR